MIGQPRAGGGRFQQFLDRAGHGGVGGWGPLSGRVSRCVFRALAAQVTAVPGVWGTADGRHRKGALSGLLIKRQGNNKCVLCLCGDG